MTTSMPQKVPARHDLVELLTEAAHEVADIRTAEYPTPPTCSYLHPVLGPLAAGPQATARLSDRLEAFVGTSPATPAELLALASLASALGWLTESLSDLTGAVDALCTQAGLPDGSVLSSAEDPLTAQHPRVDEEMVLGSPELASIRRAAETSGLTPGHYVEVLSSAQLAAARITEECAEISEGLLEDARQVAEATANGVRVVDGPDSLPRLVRTLLARLEAGQ
ncbi:hypothetical protein H1V43_22310 [Streptomyces sp. PSKA54]|uniref:Uncharacterized protein n=1 Tax=Streptomyces himalayensis subsp. aureolus TaxID=2758039 RepID=A0A7W2D3Z9_9ACTN|nr:hypothetical protein [Streptomyces himalayensis]MBA4864040.1 hypothetical protein [Streptomyces himalayensis subsp. aureolus]